MSNDSSVRRTSPAPQTPSGIPVRRKARAPLGARVALGVIAAFALLGSGMAGVNLAAVGTFNQATTSLEANIKTADEPTVDLDELKVRQQQTDAQFADAGALSPVLLPRIRQAIDVNAEVSRTLTERTEQRIAERDKAADKDQQADAGKESAKQGGGLTAEQRAKVEELLKSNQQSTDAQNKSDTASKAGSGKGTGTKGKTSSDTTKPW